MKNARKVMIGILASAAALAVAGCESVVEPKQTLNPTFGNAVRQNMAVQIINPEASAGITEAPGLDGNRVDAAVTVYQKGATKAVERIKTSNVTR